MYCLENFDTDKDGKISRREAELVKEISPELLYTQHSDFEWCDITSFKGIEYFSNLETFSCEETSVETVDLHYNTRITAVPDYAFAHCHLTKLVLPPNLTSIGEYAFEYDVYLAGFYGNLASEDNRCLILNGKLVGFAPAGLTKYSIPEGVKEIGAGAIKFLYCELTEISIPNSVTSVAEGAISGLLNLKAIFGQLASRDNRCLIVDGKLLMFASAGLTEYSIPEGVKAIGKEAFDGWSHIGGTVITIPEGVETIGDRAFIGSGLKSVTIPESVKSIGSGAFDYGLGPVTFKATTPPSLGNHAFLVNSVYSPDFVIYVPESAVDAYKTAEGWKDYAEYIRGM